MFLATLFLLFFVVLAMLLQSSFERSLLAATEANLSLQVRLLLADMDVEGTELKVLSVQEPSLNKPDSNLQAYIFSEGERAPVWVSLSAVSQSDDFVDALFTQSVAGIEQGESRFLTLDSGFVQVFRAVFALDETRVLSASGESGIDAQVSPISTPYSIAIYEDGRSYRQQVSVFQRTMLIGLFFALAIFMVLLYLVLRGLFRPLARVESELFMVENGRIDAFSGDYPLELNALTRKLNQFVESERKQRDRYKNTLSDLAHSFKTPISVIKASVSRAEPERDATTLEQVERMEQIVSHQLRRGQFPLAQSLGSRVDCVSAIDRLLLALGKIYFDKGIEFDFQHFGPCWLALPEDELMELLGNLLDNACKYADSTVNVDIALEQLDSFANDEQPRVTLKIVNDGPEIDEALLQKQVQRGSRLDENSQGQGIGLSVANAICEAYDIQLSLSQPRRGYTEVALVLPGVYVN